MLTDNDIDPWRYLKRYSIIVGFIIVILNIAIFFFVSKIEKNPPITKTNNESCYYAIDSVAVSRFSVEVNGWAFVKGQEAILHVNSVIIGDERASYVLPTKLIARKDVSVMFAVDGKNRDQSGFFSRGLKPFIPKGKYRVYVNCAGYVIDTEQDIII